MKEYVVEIPRNENHTSAFILRWTTASPTKKGYYWKYDPKFKEPLSLVEVDEVYSGLVYYDTGRDEEHGVVDVDDAYWLGPLPVPEVPKGGK